jgi:hypothetical protein
VSDSHAYVTLCVLCGCAESLDVGLAHLAELSVHLLTSVPDDLQQWIHAAHIEDGVLQHPCMQAEEMEDTFALQLCGSLTPAAVILQSPRVFGLAVTMLAMTKERGVAPESALAFAFYGLCIWSVLTALLLLEAIERTVSCCCVLLLVFACFCLLFVVVAAVLCRGGGDLDRVYEAALLSERILAHFGSVPCLHCCLDIVVARHSLSLVLSLFVR